MELSVYDYVVFALVLLISAAIGLYFRFTGGKQKTVQEYMLANGQMSGIPVAFSLMASFMSAITLLGVSSENYMYGTQFMLINLSYILGTPIVAYVYLPVFFQLRLTSVYQYLDRRFGRTARLAASIAFSLQMFLYMGIVLYAPALALSAVTGLDKVLAVLSIGSVCTFYSTIGGMKAVLLTDVFQSLLMFAAVFCVIIKGSLDMGGLGNILSIAESGGRIEFFNWDMDPTIRHTVWSQVIGGMFIFLSIYAVNQAQVQRLLTVRSLRESQGSLWLSLPILMLLSFSTALAGLTIYAKYSGCDPILQGRICAPDQLLPLFVVDTLGDFPGVPGLFIAGLLSGSLSTVSSAINSLAAVTWEDYITPCLRTTPSTVVATMWNKILACVYGLACIGMAFVASQLKGVLQASLTVFGVVGGPLFGLFTLGMLFPFVSERAAVPSFLTALVFCLVMGFGGPKPPVQRLVGEVSFCDAVPSSELQCAPSTIGNSTGTEASPGSYFYFYRISYMYYTLIGFLITIVLGSVLSLWCPQKGRVPRNLLSPLLHPLMGYSHEETYQEESNTHLDQDSITAHPEPEMSSSEELEIKNGGSMVGGDKGGGDVASSTVL